MAEHGEVTDSLTFLALSLDTRTADSRGQHRPRHRVIPESGLEADAKPSQNLSPSFDHIPEDCWWMDWASGG